MKTSMNMTFMLVLFIFTIVFPSIKSFQLFQQGSSVGSVNPYEYVVRSVDSFCALSCDGRRNYRACVIENGYEVDLEFFKNCVQQIRFYDTCAEIEDFLCNYLRTCPQEYNQFINCLGSAKCAYSTNKPYFYRTLD
ncbi:uncharacterized protein LOC111616504, partial [Centruroides sculpturatus]|uniref:uncharacterized protein LOC111616504 n=1 Tax=Centruroides sculpturatus TaxID=218467 RepID=UPI000C6E484D